jgi:hypothetical protein
MAGTSIRPAQIRRGVMPLRPPWSYFCARLFASLALARSQINAPSEARKKPTPIGPVQKNTNHMFSMLSLTWSILAESRLPGIHNCLYRYLITSALT